jgi:subtilisin family serine protease
MGIINKLTAVVLGAALSLQMGVSASFAQDTQLDFNELARNNPGGGGGTTLPKLYDWMSPEISGAWSQGFKGQGSHITIVDDFTSNNGYYGNLGTGTQLLRHGEWVRAQAGMIAPSASLASHDFYSGQAVSLDRKRLNTLNLSYGIFAADGYTSVSWSRQESSIISYARNGSAVVIKAAGNDAVTVGAATPNGLVDYLSRDLVGAQSAIFVGALDRNGTQADQAKMAWYSNTAGSNTTVQDQFLSVGVRGDLTNLYGTSFAAPVVSGYAAVLGSKFTTATPTQITNQLLDTARTDTISGYVRNVHGRGEASITRALAPVAIK